MKCALRQTQLRILGTSIFLTVQKAWIHGKGALGGTSIQRIRTLLRLRLGHVTCQRSQDHIGFWIMTKSMKVAMQSLLVANRIDPLMMASVTIYSQQWPEC